MIPRRLRSLPRIAVLLVAAMSCAGCDNGSTAMIRTLQERVDKQDLALKRCANDVADRDALLANLQRRVDANRPFANLTLDDLFTVDRIVIVDQTGGSDFDGKPGDDGVIVYVRPVDAQGDTLKAAGKITVQLLDLTDPASPRALATCEYADRDALAAAWFGGFLTDHYTLKCAIPAGLSPAREVHVRVTFLDYLTGREFVASKTVMLKRIAKANTASSQPVAQ
ncbi:MAG: hypothetical protein H6817_03940 [Phycisphaerales bacterium]|nr:hypothetical protein [Phycisphaerales bacterium]